MIRAVLLPIVATSAGCGLLRPPEPVSVERGRILFHESDLGSPRDTGAPYGLFLAMMERYPEELGSDWPSFSSRFGVLPGRDDPTGLPTGFALRRDGLTATDFLMTNCSLCHQGEIDGRRIEGIGSRTLRLTALNNAIMRVAGDEDFTPGTMVPLARAAARRADLRWGWRSDMAASAAVRRLRELALDHVEIDSGPGRSPAIEFMKAVLDLPVEPPIGHTKFGAVWTYGKRRTFGVDAPLGGDRVLAISSVEFNKRMPSGHIVGRRDSWDSIRRYIESIDPPTYPRPIRGEAAARGHVLFQTHCGGCHGTYGPGGVYAEQVIPLVVVGTDPDRVRSVTPALAAARNRTKLGRFVRMQVPTGYVAPPLDGIWCRGPYLHNGSVPTLADLLRPAVERPARFPVGGGVAYDLRRVGLAAAEAEGDACTPGGSRFVFDTVGPGNSNAGHEFGTTMTTEERDDLLEYLKTL